MTRRGAEVHSSSVLRVWSSEEKVRFPRACMFFILPSTRTAWETSGACGRFVNSCIGRKFHIGQVRLEPGIPKLLVKINPTDAESFHARATVSATFQRMGNGLTLSACTFRVCPDGSTWGVLVQPRRASRRCFRGFGTGYWFDSEGQEPRRGDSPQRRHKPQPGLRVRDLASFRATVAATLFGMWSSSEVAVLHMSRGTAAGEAPEHSKMRRVLCCSLLDVAQVLMSVKLADLLDLEADARDLLLCAS